ncbi:ribosomal protein L7/L12 [Microbacteriaceae bacterium 4G12]
MNSWFIMALLVFGILSISSSISQLDKRLKRTEDKLDQIARELGVSEQVGNEELNEELRQLVREGKKIKAIKKVREVLGLSLVDAKNYVDSL